MKRIAALIVMVLVAVFTFSACGFTKDQATDPSYQTLRYAGGDFSGSKFKECLDPGQKIATNDKLYAYPTTQRQDVWDSDNYNKGTKSADHPDLPLTAKGGVQMNFKVKVDFALNTSCAPVKDNTGKSWPGGVVQAFHELVGKTRGAYFNVGQTGLNAYSSGWLWAMDTYVSTPVIGDLTVQAKQYTPDQLWQDPNVGRKMESALMSRIESEINAGMETDLQFYHIAGIQIYSITPSGDYLDLFKQRQAAKTQAQSAKDNKSALVTEAATKSAVLHATIAGYRLPGMSWNDAVNAYLKAQVIAGGGNPFQPNVNSIQTGQ
jgi:hypothetical protein